MPLSALDDTLRHQVATTFDHVGPSDHRFFDRYAFLLYDPAGEVGIISGMGLYSNMNCLDGFACLIRSGKQHNLRLSRQLRPNIDATVIGPLAYEMVEPLQSHRLTVATGEHGFSFDLLWEGTIPPHEEAPHFTRVNGRPAQDYRRFDQVGRANGWVEIDGERLEADNWWTIRDHSWGVRPGVGGYEPDNGPATGLLGSSPGGLFFWITFLTDNGSGVGYAQLHEDSLGKRLFFDGHVRRPDGNGEVEVVELHDVDHQLSFYDGTRVLESMRLTLRPARGEPIAVTGERLLGAPFAWVGSGYDDGFDDGKGLGHYRGEYVEEHDVYDVSHPENVVLPDGAVTQPLHREGPFELRVDGELAWAHVTIVPVGVYEPCGFTV